MASTYRSPLDVILATVVRFENRIFGGGLQNVGVLSFTDNLQDALNLQKTLSSP